jgi:KDO2-lipid IV(A) lauroyltransferase
MSGVGMAILAVPPGHRYRAVDVFIGLLIPLLTRIRPVIAWNFGRVLGVPVDAADAQRLARASIINFGRMAVDFLAVSAMSRAGVLAWVEPQGEARFAAVQALNRGIILALPHLGSWDVAAAFATAYGLRLTVVTRDDWMASIVEASRRTRGVRIVREGASARPLFTALRAGECVAVLCDIEKAYGGSLDVPFFGFPAPFPLGPARLAARTGAPIVVISCTRTASLGFAVKAYEPLLPDPALPQTERLERLTAGIASRFEDIIRQFPSQWYPFHRIWPDTPHLDLPRWA